MAVASFIVYTRRVGLRWQICLNSGPLFELSTFLLLPEKPLWSLNHKPTRASNSHLHVRKNRTKPLSRRPTNCERLSLIFLFPNICFQSAPVTFWFARKVDNFRSESNLFILVRSKYVKISMLFLRIDHYACCYMFIVLSLIGVCVWITVSVSTSGDLDFRAIFFIWFCRCVRSVW